MFSQHPFPLQMTPKKSLKKKTKFFSFNPSKILKGQNLGHSSKFHSFSLYMLVINFYREKMLN